LPRILAFCLLFALLGVAAAHEGSYGILLLAHGGDPSWNREIMKIRSALEAETPAEAAFGMADAREIQAAVKRLEARRVSKIVAVPLFVNSRSEVMDQTRYVLGLSLKPSEILRDALSGLSHQDACQPQACGAHHHSFSLERVRSSLPLVLTPALDGHPLVAEILLERARALSREPGRETVILVGHGPVDEEANREWLTTMKSLAGVVRARGGFGAVLAATIRDDSPQEVKAAAAQALRRMVREGVGRVLVVPHLIARGGIERHILAILEGLTYSWDGRTLCPHPNMALWAAQAAAEGARREDMKRFWALF